MPLAEIPPDERERVAALYELKLLDTPPEERFDRLSRLAARELKAPVAYVALLEGERQWFKSQCGLGMTETPRQTSLCSHTILTFDGIMCPDTHLEPRFADNPYVVGEPHVRFYMGLPLKTPDGYNVGTFCVLGFEPRPITAEEITLFLDLAALAETELNLMDLLTMQQELRAHRTSLLEQNHQLAQANHKLLESLHYARLIQNAILAKPADMALVFPESFAFWRPRDIVGGDYYTLYLDAEGGFVLAVADCTGHGVPGAFMSMGSKALLDGTVMRGLEDPAALLGELHASVQGMLSRDEPGAHNGLDVALVCGRVGSSRLTFAGAKLHLWIQEPDGSFRVVKGDRYSLGYARFGRELAFQNHVIEMQPGQRFYLLTDGILDQSGGPKGIGLGQRRLQEALAGWKTVPMAELPALLEGMLQEYQGALPQRDDITVLGFSAGPSKELK